MVCHTSNYPVPQMVDILHLLRIHEILQAPRSNSLEGLALLIYLLPIEIRTQNQSPDLTPIDCFFSEHDVKMRVYAEKVQDISHLERS